jgi:hypothetical protein
VRTNFADLNQTFRFIKNQVMTGGLLQVATYGAGALSIDNRAFDEGLDDWRRGARRLSRGPSDQVRLAVAAEPARSRFRKEK